MSKRFVTYFGVSIPPWKGKKIGAGSTTIRFVIQGKIPSKKNNQQAVAIRKAARDYIKEIVRQKGSITPAEAQFAISKTYAKMRSNKEYHDFILATRPSILEQMRVWSDRLKEKGLIFPISKASLSIRFYFNSRYVIDTVNKYQSVNDLLVDCGVVANDDYNTLNPVVSASECYVEEIVDSIAFISLSFKLKQVK